MRFWSTVLLCATMLTTAAGAAVPAEVVRESDTTLVLNWSDPDPVSVYMTDDPAADAKKARLIARKVTGGTTRVEAPTGRRVYFLLRDHGDNSFTRLSERVVPLERGSNFRDLGGYVTADGRRVRWGKIYRSGAMPLLSDRDYDQLGALRISSIIDLRSTDERQIAPDELDDRTGAMFLSNDYSLRKLMAGMATGNGEYVYRGIGKSLAPQYRSIFRRLLANDGATMFHCSAGQDRTGVAAALILSALGVPRKTILADYHLSTQLRRPQYEMPPINPADWPGNPIVPYYVAGQSKPGGPKAEPLYSAKGISHLVQFFEVIDQEYGSVEMYLQKELGITPLEIVQLKKNYLD